MIRGLGVRATDLAFREAGDPQSVSSKSNRLPLQQLWAFLLVGLV